MSNDSTEDFANLIRISTAQIVCFELSSPISCSLENDSFAELLYTISSQCIDGSLTCAQASGFSDVDSMLGHSLERILPASQGYRELFKQWHLRSLSAQSFEASVQRPGDPPTTISVVVYGKIDRNEHLSRFWLVIRDVTPQMRAVRALASSELHYRSLIEGPGVIFARVNTSGYYEYISPFLAEALEVSLEDVASRRRRLCEWVHPDDQEKVDTLLASRDAAHAHSVTELELRLKMFGEYRALSIRQLPALDHSGDLAFIDLLATDITHLKILQAELARLRPQALAGQLAAGVAHDIRNYITACLGHLENLQASVSPDTTLDRSSLNAALAACRATLDLAATFTSSSASGSGQCDVAHTLSSVAILLRPVLPKSLRLHIPAIPKGLRVPLSATELQNVLCNLILNARDAIGSKDGEVRLTVTRKPPSSSIIITIEDNGPGIPTHVLPHIFDPYFSSKKSTGGTGLGLTSVREAINSVGGTIKAHSAPGRQKGACFTISLPLVLKVGSLAGLSAKPPRSAARSNADTTSSRASPPLRILVADDEAGICSMLEVALARKGHAVDVVSDSERFMTQAATGASRYDLLVIDESLPKKRSTEVLPYLRSLMPETPIIVTSGDHTIKEAIQRTTSSVFFLPKPFSLHDLEGAIQESCRT